MNRTEEDLSNDCQMDPTLTVELSTHEQLCVLRMTGELNQSSVPALQVQMDQVGCSQCYEVLLDLTALRGVDVTGLGALVRLDRHIRAIGAKMRVIGAREGMKQKLANVLLTPRNTRPGCSGGSYPVDPAIEPAVGHDCHYLPLNAASRSSAMSSSSRAVACQ